MKGTIALVLLAVTAASAHAQAAPNHGPNAGDPYAVKIMALGDTITVGGNSVAAFSFPGGYRTILWRMLEDAEIKADFVGDYQYGCDAQVGDCDVQAIPWAKLADMTANWYDAVARYQPDIILAYPPVNDILQQFQPGTFRGKVYALLDMLTAQAPNATVIIATIPHTKDFDVKPWNTALRAAVALFPRVQLMENPITQQSQMDGWYPWPGPAGDGLLAASWMWRIRDVVNPRGSMMLEPDAGSAGSCAPDASAGPLSPPPPAPSGCGYSYVPHGGILASFAVLLVGGALILKRSRRSSFRGAS